MSVIFINIMYINDYLFFIKVTFDFSPVNGQRKCIRKDGRKVKDGSYSEIDIDEENVADIGTCEYICSQVSNN